MRQSISRRGNCWDNGTSIVFTALTLAAGVATWMFSALKFQADMGMLLMLLFIWNMIGTLVLTPALASVLVFGKGARLSD